MLLQAVSDDVRHAGATNKFPSAANVLIVWKSVTVIAGKALRVLHCSNNGLCIQTYRHPSIYTYSDVYINEC